MRFVLAGLVFAGACIFTFDDARQRAPDGEPCTDDAACHSARCAHTTCAGSTCRVETDCRPGWSCEAGLCAAHCGSCPPSESCTAADQTLCGDLTEDTLTLTATPAVVNVPVQFAIAGSPRALGDCAWTFGDGATGAGTEVVHTYTAAGTYHVDAMATDVLGFTGGTGLEVVVP